ncbi:uncharacterized protein LY89DRAFT_558278, partial [Mollisia scopiformis]
YMLEHGWNPSSYGHNDAHPLTIAAQSFPPSTLKFLLDHGVSPRGTQAMHAAVTWAAIDGEITGGVVTDPTRYEVLDLLLQYGADVNEMEVDPKARRPPRRRDGFTGTPLHRAIGQESLEMVKYLLENGASP